MGQINFQQKREFGEKIGVVLQFYKENFVHYAINFAILTLPIWLFIGFLAYYFIENNFEHLTALFRYNFNSGKALTLIAPLYLMLLVFFSYTSAVTYTYFLLYEKKGEKQFNLSELLGATLSALSKLLVANTIFTLLVFLFIALITAFVATIGGLMLGFLMLPLGIFSIIYGIRVSLYPVILLKEEKGIFSALTRSISLTKGYWWETFGIMLVLGIIAMIISQFVTTIFSFLGLEMFNAESLLGKSFNFTATLMLSYILSQFIISILTSMLSIGGIFVQYAALTADKEGAGLKDQVEKLGKTPDNDKDEEDF
ncbi:MAG: hypothetical protein SFU27_12010 [Thermonemataceae bacterium]|nr:hypothetical protein [Thermonemataceae bacterium]